MKPHRTTILILAIIASVLALPLVAAAPTEVYYQNPEACQILTFNGFLNDYDCDGVHDQIDNCPEVPNAPQYDSNRNGIGDACDLIIEELFVDPSVLVKANQFIKLNLLLVNNQKSPIYGIDVTVKNDDLNFDVLTNIPAMGAGEARNLEFLLKIPRCTPEKSYQIDVKTKFLHEGKEHVQADTTQVKVVPGGECATSMTLMENTLVETFAMQEIDVGDRAIIPVRIINLNQDAVSYTVRLEGFDHWGTFRIDPASEFTLPSGHDLTSYIAIELEEFAEPGDHTMNVVITSDDDESESFPITLRIRKPVSQKQSEQLKQALEVTLILIIIVILIVGFVIAYKKMNEPGEIETRPQTTKEVLKKEGVQVIDE